MIRLARLRNHLDRVRAAMPDGPLVPIVPLPPGEPYPAGTRPMSSEEVYRSVCDAQAGLPTWRDKLTPAQRSALDAQFDRWGGVARVIQMQRELLATTREGPS